MGELDGGTTPIPGTVHLVDLEGTMVAKHAKGAQKVGRRCYKQTDCTRPRAPWSLLLIIRFFKDIVLVPAPSSDPDDPVSCHQADTTLRELMIIAQLVSSKEIAQHGMHVCLHSDGWYRQCRHLLSAGAHLRSN